MRNSEVPVDEMVRKIFDLLSTENLEEAKILITKATAAYPFDSRTHVLEAVAAQALGQISSGFQSLWNALAAQPFDPMSRNELIEAMITRKTAIPEGRDLSLLNGERQIAERIDLIRTDHRARYLFAARWIRDHFEPARLKTGLDVFCGNGYGSQIVANVSGARMVGIDGSGEAVSLAEQRYGSHRTVFGQAFFPFELKNKLFDFAISFESIEHIDTPKLLLKQMAEATDGPFIISIPHECGLPFLINKNHFRYHIQHYTREEIIDLLAEAGRPVISGEWGQLTYKTKDKEITGLLPEADMGLRPVDDNSQFLILVAEKNH